MSLELNPLNLIDNEIGPKITTEESAGDMSERDDTLLNILAVRESTTTFVERKKSKISIKSPQHRLD